MVDPDVIGGIASCLTTASFLPQVWKVLRTKDTHSISLLMYSMFTCGVSLWFIYGIMIHSWPIMIGNAITVLCASIILAMKIRLG